MGKKPKGFGQPVQPQRKKSKPSSQAVPLSLHPLLGCEFLWEKEARIRQIFNRHSIPDVSATSLNHYRNQLNKQLLSGIALEIGEALDWEIPYLYGRFNISEHQKQRQQRPSYLDSYQFLSLSNTISLKTGLGATVQRITDQQQFDLPLSHFQAPSTQTLKPASSAYTALADYCLWWEDYRPFLIV